VKVVTNLEKVFSAIHVTEDYAKFLDDQRRGEVARACIQLMISMVQYFSMIRRHILLATRRSGSSTTSSISSSTRAFDESPLETDKLRGIRGKIVHYTAAIGILRVMTLPPELERDTRRMNLLEWLGPGEYWGRHDHFRKRRIEDIGHWVLQTDIFKQWESFSGCVSPNISFLGTGMTFLLT
jgi:hypothetical protein